MDTISYRELQRAPVDKLLSMLPLGITVDSQGKAIILSIEGYRALLDKYRQLDSQAKIPLYNPALHRPGSRVLVEKGKRLVVTIVPEIDAEGYPIPLV